MVALPSCGSTTSTSSWSLQAGVLQSEQKKLLEAKLCEDETQELEQWMTQEVPVATKNKRKPKKGAVKKPASSSGSSKKPTKGKSFVQRMTEKKAAQTTHKSSWQKRAKDSAYHKARKAAKKEGKSDEAALQLAKEASKKVAEAIEKGELEGPWKGGYNTWGVAFGKKDQAVCFALRISVKMWSALAFLGFFGRCDKLWPCFEISLKMDKFWSWLCFHLWLWLGLLCCVSVC